MRGDHWRVLGRSVLVRHGQSLNSEAADCLCHGAILLELDLVGERLQFKKLQGDGPETGWLSIRVKDKELLERIAAKDMVGPVVSPRLWAMSDIHTDKKENMQWILDLDPQEFQEDVLILAGDIANTMEVLQETLLLLKSRFSRIFFCPGNHDLWMQGWKNGNSLDKLQAIVKFCKAEGIETAPGVVNTGAGPLLVVPIFAWHHPQWDTEPELDEWNVPPLEKTIVDYWATKWPADLRIDDGSVAEELDKLNASGFAEALKRRDEFHGIVSFSHFVPRLEVNPEKRYLIPSSLAKAVGSLHLKKRVDELKPDVHIFGHTHFGYDMDVDGIRYLQAALGTPVERTWGSSIVTLGDFPQERRPCLVWSGAWSPRHRSAWTQYYQRYGRRAEVTELVPSVCCNLYTPKVTAACRSGWIKGRMPIWLFGPLETRLQEAQMVIREVHEITGWDVRGKNAKALEKLPRSSQGEPRSVEASQAIGWHKEASYTFIDVRNQGDHGCIPGAISLPHPEATETLASLEDDEVLRLCEQLNAKGGHMLIIGDEASSWDAAMLLAGYFRMWPCEMSMVSGGWASWLGGWWSCGGSQLCFLTSCQYCSSRYGAELEPRCVQTVNEDFGGDFRCSERLEGLSWALDGFGSLIPKACRICHDNDLSSPLLDLGACVGESLSATGYMLAAALLLESALGFDCPDLEFDDEQPLTETLQLTCARDSTAIFRTTFLTGSKAVRAAGHCGGTDTLCGQSILRSAAALSAVEETGVSLRVFCHGPTPQALVCYCYGLLSSWYIMVLLTRGCGLCLVECLEDAWLVAQASFTSLPVWLRKKMLSCTATAAFKGRMHSRRVLGSDPVQANAVASCCGIGRKARHEQQQRATPREHRVSSFAPVDIPTSWPLPKFHALRS
eukprot:s551_g3.t2